MDDRRPAIILDEGTAQWRWSRGYADNLGLATALAAMDERAAGQIYNVAEVTAFTEAEWVRMIGQTAGWEGDVVVAPKDRCPAHLGFGIDTAQQYVLDTSKIRNELGYEETVAHDEALSRTITWERDHPPEDLDLEKFDYAAEDRVLADLT